MAERLKAFVAVHLLLIDGDKVLLLRRFNTGYHDGDYSVPAGHVDVGETASNAMIRETKEEIGIDIMPENLRFTTIMHRQSDDKEKAIRIDYFFSCRNWNGEIVNCEDNKCDDLKWFSTSELPANIVSYVKEGIRCYAEQKNYSEFGWE